MWAPRPPPPPFCPPQRHFSMTTRVAPAYSSTRTRAPLLLGDPARISVTLLSPRSHAVPPGAPTAAARARPCVMRAALGPRSGGRQPRDGPVGPRPEQEARTDGDGRASRTHVTLRASCSVSLCSARGLGSNGRHAAGSTRGGWEAKWVHVAWQPGSRGPRLGVTQSASRGPGHGGSPGARRPR